jgi:DNA helicase-2/ATP-dependent DNA helicase PcrA
VPHRFFSHSQRRNGDRHLYALRTRFIPADILEFFESCSWPVATATATIEKLKPEPLDIGGRLRQMWNG